MKYLYLKISLLFLIIFIVVSPLYSQNGAENKEGIDVLNYEINLDIHDVSKKQIAGNTKITFLQNKGHQEKITLSLIDFTINKVFLNNKQISNFDYKKDKITIDLGKKYTLSDTLIVNVFYSGKPAEDPSWGGFFFSENTAYNIGVGMKSVPHGFGRAWFPCVDSFEDRATFGFNINVKEGYKAVCSGVLSETIKNSDGSEIYKWIQNDEVPTYLVSIAVGEYEKIEYEYEGLEKKIPVQLFVNQKFVEKTKKSFQNLPKAIKTYEANYYPYVWDRVGFVGVPFKSGAMEHVCNIAYPNYAIDGTLDKETLMAHELSHHWFGNLVTCKTASDMWLNEGWASFSEAIFIEEVYGNARYKEYSRNRHRFVLDLVHRYDGGYYSVAGVPDHLTYSSTVYKKGADVAHSLRGYLGDSVFFDVIHEYFEHNKFSTVSTKEFQLFLSAKTGVDMESFFNSWLYSPGFMHFQISNTKYTKARGGSEKNAKYNTEITVNQRLIEQPKFGEKNLIELTFLDKDFKLHTFIGDFSGEKSTCKLNLDFNPKFIFLDLNEKVMDATVDCYNIIEKPDNYVFKETDFSLKVVSSGKKAFVRSILNIIPPLEGENCKFILSKNRYWTLEGSINKDFSGDGTFYFSMDKQKLTTNRSDLKLLYRKSLNSEWKEVVAAKYFPKLGDKLENFQVKNLELGEYTIGILKP